MQIKANFYNMTHNISYYFILVFFVFCFWGCTASKPMPDTVEGVLYGARQDMKNEDYVNARKKLYYLEATFPASDLLPQARILLADSLFKERSWNEAVVKYQNFLNLHPTHHYADRAQLFLCKSYFRNIERKELFIFSSPVIDRDLEPVYKAMKELEKMFKLYPYSRYMDDARKLYSRCRKILAENQYYIGEFYLKTQYYPAAVRRFRKIVREYTDVPETREKAYFNLAESYWRWNRKEEGVRIFKHFLEDYPSSQFTVLARERIYE